MDGAGGGGGGSEGSGGSSSDPPPTPLALRARALALDAERAALSHALDLLLLELGPSAAGSLVDAEGYPRGDIDVHAVRLLRGRAACLRTDLAAKAAEAERALLALHACGAAALAALPPLPAAGAQAQAQGAQAQASSPRRSLYLPLGVLSRVEAGGPAAAGGLLPGDEVLTWGKLGPVLDVPGEEEEQRAALPQLSALGREAAAAAEGGAALRVKVLREGRAVELALRPGPWGGAGCLGCLVVPK